MPATLVPLIVVMPPNPLLLDFSGPLEAVRRANLAQGAVRFEVRFVGPTMTCLSSIGLMLADIAPLPDRLPDNCLLMLPGSISPPNPHHLATRLQENTIVDWLRRVVGPRHKLICICAGALLAARAGLLDDHHCTTHYECIDELRAVAPRAIVQENRLFVEDGMRLTSAGVTAGVDLMLHLIAQMLGPATAVAIARFLVIYLRRGGDDPQQSPWLDGRNHLHLPIHVVQDAILADPSRNWRLGDLAAMARVSPRTLSRLFCAKTGMSITDYIHRMRLVLARQLIEQTRLDMELIAERTGYGSSRQLRRVWSRFYAGPPRDIRKTQRAA